MSRPRQSGFTIIELMITVAVVAILLTVGVPSMQTLVRNNQLTTQTNEFVSALQLARSEAAKRNVPVTVRASNATSGNQFGGGWTVFRDVDSNGALDAGQQPIKSMEALKGDNTISTSPESSEVRFLPTGMVAGGVGVAFDICLGEGLPGRRVTLLVSGRISTSEIESCTVASGSPGGGKGKG